MGTTNFPKQGGGDVQSVSVSGSITFTYSSRSITGIASYPNAFDSASYSNGVVTLGKSGKTIVGIGSFVGTAQTWIHSSSSNTGNLVTPLTNDLVPAFSRTASKTDSRYNYWYDACAVRITDDGKLSVNFGETSRPDSTGNYGITVYLRLTLYYI